MPLASPRLLGVFAALFCALPASSRPPNLLLIVADDLGYADVGFHGCKDIPTPHLDALAGSGTRCSQGYVSGPYCSPTRAGLLTGRYQQRFGHDYNPAGAAQGLPPGATLLPQRLKEAGYATGLVGKWHLGLAAERQPPRRGFDEFFGFLGGAHPYLPERAFALLRGATPVAEKEYLTDALAREAIAFVDKHKAKPFFLYLAFNAVHTPMEADQARLKRFASIADARRRTYAAMLSAADDAVGKVLAKVRDAGLEKETLILFISDNGGPTMQGTTINGSSNAPFRGSKRTTLEGGIRVPFALSWPGRIAAGKVYSEPVIQLDLTATMLAAAGLVPRPDWKLDGVDLLPHFDGKSKQPPHDALYWRFGNQAAIRMGDLKLVRYDPVADGGPARPRSPLASKLYDLAKDPGETNDLAAAHPDKVASLRAKWKAWNAGNAAPLWGQPATDEP